MPSFTGRVRAADQLSRLLGGRPLTVRRVDWDALVALATEQRIAPLMYARAREALPPAVVTELRQAVLLTTTHNLRWRAAIVEIVGALNAGGIEPLLLKGGAMLLDGTPGAAGWRFMADLDLTVPAADGARAAAALRRLGYEPPDEKPLWHRHETVLISPRAPGAVELHTEVGDSSIAAVLPVAEAWARSRELPVAGGHARALSPTDAALHNILHSSVQDFTHAGRGLPLRQLATLAAIAQRYPGEIDWAQIERRMARHGLRGHLTAYVWIAHRYAALPLPPGYPARRGHELLTLLSFGLGWPMPVYTNLRYALGSEYMRASYGDIPLVAARWRHVRSVLTRDGRAVVDALLERDG